MRNPSGWKRLFRLRETAGQIDRNVDEELQFHITGLTDKYMAMGMSEEEARVEALRRFGALDETRAELRKADHYRRRRKEQDEFLSSVWSDFRVGLRGFIKTPGFSLLVVLLLGLGIGANTSMFSILNAALLKQLPYEDSDNLVFCRRTNFEHQWYGWVSAYDYFDYRERNQSFAQLTATTGFPQRHTITGGEEAERLAGFWIGWDLFQTLGIDPQFGRHFTPEEGAAGGNNNVVIISDEYWQRRFGDSEEAIGSSLIIDGTPYTIVGVMPAGFRFRADVDFWRPMFRDGPFAGGRQWHNWFLVGRLNEGVTIEAAQAEMDVISAQLAQEYPDTNEDKALHLTGLHDYLVEGWRTNLLLLMAALGLVLLIVCSNVSALLLARGTTRQTEMAVRSAMGASRGRLIQQLLTESLQLVVFACFMGVLLTIWLQNLMLRLPLKSGLGITELTIDLPVLLFALIISIFTGLIFGIIPAFRGTPVNLADHLKTGYRITDVRGGGLPRSILVVMQVALSILLLVGTGLLIRSFSKLMNVETGFDTVNLLTAGVQLTGSEYPDPEQRIQFFTGLVEEIEALPDVRAVGLISQLPIRSPGNDRHVWDPENPPSNLSSARTANGRVILPGYFEVMGIRLLSGRNIEETDVLNSPGVLVISETMAQAIFPDQDPLGKRVAIDFGQVVEIEVIGVVSDVRMSSMASDPHLAMYLSYRQGPGLSMQLAVRTAGSAASIVGPVREILKKHDPNIPLAEPRTMESIIAESVSDRRVITSLLVIFSAAALVLALVGLYGVLAYYVSRQSHEIGVRMALGASGPRVLRMVLSRGMILVWIGIVIGISGAFGTNRLLQHLLFNTESTDPATFIGVILVYVTIAVLACLVPGWRATKVDPIIALQAE